LDDAQRALSVLLQAAEIDESRVGVAGHSYGGYTALYHAAADTRCRFVCVSGAVCSFERRRREGTGITLFETVPGLARQIDTHDVLSAIGHELTLICSIASPESRSSAIGQLSKSRLCSTAQKNCRLVYFAL
jgi:pimeloyl-ACP methyl ester carboxylesterase